MKKIAFIGVGNMASAMIGGITSSGHTAWKDILLYNRHPEKAGRFAALGAVIADGIAEAVREADCVVLAVKPQNYPEVLPEIRAVGDLTGKLFISIAAGITTGAVSDALGGNIPVVRALPNTPMLIGKGVSAICKNEFVSEEAFRYAKAVFDASGDTLVIDESEMNRIICVTSSSPAYVFLLIRAMYDAAISQGLPASGLVDSICNTVIGSAELLKAMKKTPDEMISMVASKGGTTERALATFEARDFSGIVKDAMQACTDRADKLGRKS